MKRSELYAAIWVEPITRLAERLGCSDTWLRSICKGLSIPQPPRGYWARVHGRQNVQRPALPPGEDVDIGLRVQVPTPNSVRSAQATDDVPTELPKLLASNEHPLQSIVRPRPARFAAMLEHSVAHRRIWGMRQLYKDAKTWRRHREVSDFLSQLALNVVHRDAPDRSTVLGWIEQMRKELDASDPIRECIERVIAFGDSLDSTTPGLRTEAARGGFRR